jgi:hypothetical protein
MRPGSMATKHSPSERISITREGFAVLASSTILDVTCTRLWELARVMGMPSPIRASVMSFFDTTIAEDGNELVLIPTRLPAQHDVFDLRPDNRPDLLPAVRSTLPHRRGVLTDAEARQVSIVVELNEIRAPPQEHRMTRVEEHRHERLQAVRPGVGGPDPRGAADTDEQPISELARDRGERRWLARLGLSGPGYERTPRERASIEGSDASRIRGRRVHDANLTYVADEKPTVRREELAPVTARLSALIHEKILLSRRTSHRVDGRADRDGIAPVFDVPIHVAQVHPQTEQRRGREHHEWQEPNHPVRSATEIAMASHAAQAPQSLRIFRSSPSDNLVDRRLGRAAASRLVHARGVTERGR